MLTFFAYLLVLGYLFQHDRKQVKLLITPWFIFLISFILAMVAPGNSVRTSSSEPEGIFKAVFSSVSFAIQSFAEWFNVLILLFIVLAIPIMYNIIVNTQFSFKNPGIISCISLILFSVQFFPHAYALGSIGPDRLLNIIYFSFLFLLLFNVFYWMGWICKGIWSRDINHGNLEMKYSVISLGGIGLIIGIFCIVLSQRYPSSSLAAIHSMATGEGKQYYEENQERLDLLKNDLDDSVILKEHTKKPMLLFWDDGTEDSDDWRNKAMANFYGKDRIVVE